ncbi:putative oxidoreductase C-terminal domain-containing protein [Chryseolinea sp. T2]|uniref:putative oxidoreductase C-terminal domain-containing protein n=1 Tax=Chryseolinea sp. T2 TaxID=3129255 RepID=UPI0030788E5B
MSICRPATTLFVGAASLVFSTCKPKTEEHAVTSKPVQIITVDPGHFHAALVQKSMYGDVDSTVHVYAPAGPDVDMHLTRIDNFNKRADQPTRWNEVVYTGADFFDKAISEKKGNVIVLAGNNEKKTEYIARSIDAGFNVLGDKPMAIDAKGFDLLKTAFTQAASKNLLLYDVMTERYEITTILQKELSQLPEVFGTLEPGTPDNPSVTKESVHHFFKYVSGSILTRPPWFMDVKQEGEGIVDVTTHLVDLVQWECFPEQSIDYTKDIEIGKSKRTKTKMTLSQFKAITKLEAFPEYLKPDVKSDTILEVYSNGEINYKIKDVHARVSVIWNYAAPEGAGDTHYSIMRGTKANLVIRQGKEEQFKPTLYIEPLKADQFEAVLTEQFKKIQEKHAGVELKKNAKGWEVVIPEQYKEGHEAHFARVMEKFLEYLKDRNMPAWEVPNMLAKYYTTTKALEVAVKEP